MFLHAFPDCNIHTKGYVHIFNVSYKNVQYICNSSCVAPMRPVEVTVSARTIIGVGQDASEIFFTSEGSKEVPQLQPA